MYYLLLFSALLINFLVSSTEDRTKHIGTENINKNNVLTNTITKNNVASHHNITYIDKAENMLRTPNINKYYEEHKKKKKPKKAPKRTIQKIIKKNRAKLRKLYITKTRHQTTTPRISKVDYEKLYAQDDKQWRDEPSTTQVNQRKKPRKYKPKVAGYHMPFQKLQSKKDKRIKRGGLSRELYILKDLDEIEFLSKEDGDDVVKAHVKNFW